MGVCWKREAISLIQMNQIDRIRIEESWFASGRGDKTIEVSVEPQWQLNTIRVIL